jgi:hypothetical protein
MVVDCDTHCLTHYDEKPIKPNMENVLNSDELSCHIGAIRVGELVLTQSQELR